MLNFIFIFIFIFNDTRAFENKWLFLDYVKVDPKNYKVIIFNEDIDLQIQFYISESKKTLLKFDHKFPKKAYIVIPPNDEESQFTLYSNKQVSYTEKVIISKRDILVYQLLSRISELNFKKNNIRKFLASLNSFINSATEKNIIFYEIINRYGILLLELEEYQAVIDLFNTHNLSLSTDKYQVYLYRFILAQAFLNSGRYSKAEILLMDLSNQLEKDNSLNVNWTGSKLEVTALLGFSKSLEAFFNNGDASVGLNLTLHSYQQAKNVKDTYLNIRILYLLSSALTLNGQYELSLSIIDQALEIANNKDIDYGLYYLFNQKAVNFVFLNQLYQAQLNYRMVLEQINPEIQPYIKAGINYNLANTYLKLGDYSRAQRFFKTALEMYLGLNSTYESFETLNLLGDIDRKENRIEHAIEKHKSNIEQLGQYHEKLFYDSIIKLAKDYYANSNFHNSINEILKLFLIKKNKTYKKKLGYYRSLSRLNQNELLETFNNEVGKVEFETFTDIEAIIVLLNSNLRLNNSDKINNHYENLKQSNLIESLPIDVNLEYLNFLTHYSISRNDYKYLDKRISDTILLINENRTKFDVSDLALHWTHQAQSIINKYVDVLLEQEKHQEIFKLLEKYYAINLREKRFNQTEAIIKQKSEEIQQALDDYVRLEREVLLTEDDETQRQADEAKEHFLALNGDGEELPEKVELDYLSIEDVQAHLREGQLLLRYYVNDNNAFVFVIDQQQWHVKQLPDPSELNSKVKGLLEKITAKAQLASVEQGFIAEILPLEEINQGNYEKLIVIADGVMNLLPFSMLNVAQQGSYQPLVNIIDVERTYSASDYFSDYIDNEQDKRSISVFANPVFLSEIDDQDILDTVTDNNILRTFQALPSTGKDVNDIKTVFNDFDISLFTREKATNENFLSEINRNANIMHIGTHGFFNDKALDNVGIATSIINEHGQRAPGALAMREILYQPFKANLAVVSGCETTRGKQINGEGFNSLSRGLLSQGVNAVIGTIWSIPDRATSVFMLTFYTNLRGNGGDVSQALNLTKRQFASDNRYRRYRHPHYWAGFVLTSSNQKISENVF